MEPVIDREQMMTVAAKPAKGDRHRGIFAKCNISAPERIMMSQGHHPAACHRQYNHKSKDKLHIEGFNLIPETAGRYPIPAPNCFER